VMAGARHDPNLCDFLATRIVLIGTQFAQSRRCAPRKRTKTA
jgi:hypothetical protein